MGDVLIVEDSLVVRKAIKALIKHSKPDYNVFTYEHASTFLSDRESMTQLLSANSFEEAISQENDPPVCKRSLLSQIDAAILDLQLDYNRADVKCAEDGTNYFHALMRWNIPIIVYTASEKSLTKCLDKGAFYAFKKTNLNKDSDKLLDAVDMSISSKLQLLEVSDDKVDEMLLRCWEVYKAAQTEPNRLFYLAALYRAFSLNPEILSFGVPELENCLQEYSTVRKAPSLSLSQVLLSNR